MQALLLLGGTVCPLAIVMRITSIQCSDRLLARARENPIRDYLPGDEPDSNQQVREWSKTRN